MPTLLHIAGLGGAAVRVRGRPVAEYGQPPALLAGPSFVEDWLTPAELQALRERAEIEARMTTVNGRPSAVGEFLDLFGRLGAYRRWQAARLDWLDGHGIPAGLEREVLPHRRPPTWRTGEC